MRKRPKHLSFACRPGDLAEAAATLGIDLSFCHVRFGDHEIPRALRSPRIPPRVEVARASARHFSDISGFFFPDFWLTIALVPRPLAGAVRALMRAEGLSALLRWLDARRRLPDTARTTNVALHLDWDDGRLVTRHSETPSWKMRGSP
ncbi:MAG: hypothetical protein ACHQ1G_01215 [Planctomycetota bacterium]